MVSYGAIEFYQAAKKSGIKPIIGCEVYVAPGSRLEKKSSIGPERGLQPPGPSRTKPNGLQESGPFGFRRSSGGLLLQTADRQGDP